MKKINKLIAMIGLIKKKIDKIFQSVIKSTKIGKELRKIT